MNGVGFRYAVAGGLVTALALLLVLPEEMIQPGAPLKAHRDFGDDCFTCHTPFRGSRTEKCVVCHAVDRIGRFTTRGEPVLVQEPRTRPPFHQALSDQHCQSCHVEHAGSARTQMAHRFAHELLQPSLRDRCANCHVKPTDSLHRQIAAGCGRCHSPQRWTPATFEHGEYFQIDRDHDAPCATCHTGSDFGHYSCYGCHEHSKRGIRREHVEEGIREFENCVECHRSAEEPDEHHGNGNDDD